jgi:hypothetical protein
VRVVLASGNKPGRVVFFLQILTVCFVHVTGAIVDINAIVVWSYLQSVGTNGIK